MGRLPTRQNRMGGETIKTPNTLNEWLIAAADALTSRNTDDLIRLAEISSGWMQDDETAQAQQSLVGAMLDACYDMEDLV